MSKLIKPNNIVLIVAKYSDDLPELRESILHSLATANPKDQVVYRGNSVPTEDYSSSTLVFNLRDVFSSKEYFEHALKELKHCRHKNNHLVFTTYDPELSALRNLTHHSVIGFKAQTRLQILSSFLTLVIHQSESVKTMFKEEVDPSIDERIAFTKTSVK